MEGEKSGLHGSPGCLSNDFLPPDFQIKHTLAFFKQVYVFVSNILFSLEKRSNKHKRICIKEIRCYC